MSKEKEVEKSADSIEMLNGTEVVVFDEEKANLTMDNPENDWSDKITDGIGGDE